MEGKVQGLRSSQGEDLEEDEEEKHLKINIQPLHPAHVPFEKMDLENMSDEDLKAEEDLLLKIQQEKRKLYTLQDYGLDDIFEYDEGGKLTSKVATAAMTEGGAVPRSPPPGNADGSKNTDRRASKPEQKVKFFELEGCPTKVLLLRNMVGPGELDDKLEVEVRSKCAKYGTLTRVLIFEITEANFPADEAVRIFVQFERLGETIDAYLGLDGLYFKGRMVRASFYDEDKFGKNELAPIPGEIPGLA